MIRFAIRITHLILEILTVFKVTVDIEGGLAIVRTIRVNFVVIRSGHASLKVIFACFWHYVKEKNGSWCFKISIKPLTVLWINLVKTALDLLKLLLISAELA